MIRQRTSLCFRLLCSFFLVVLANSLMGGPAVALAAARNRARTQENTRKLEQLGIRPPLSQAEIQARVTSARETIARARAPQRAAQAAAFEYARQIGVEARRHHYNERLLGLSNRTEELRHLIAERAAGRTYDLPTLSAKLLLYRAALREGLKLLTDPGARRAGLGDHAPTRLEQDISAHLSPVLEVLDTLPVDRTLISREQIDQVTESLVALDGAHTTSFAPAHRTSIDPTYRTPIDPPHRTSFDPAYGPSIQTPVQTPPQPRSRPTVPERAILSETDQFLMFGDHALLEVGNHPTFPAEDRAIPETISERPGTGDADGVSTISRHPHPNPLPQAGQGAEPQGEFRTASYFTRYTSGTNPAAIAEVVVYPTKLITATSCEEVNAPGGSLVYQVRAANGAGYEGDPATLEVPLGTLTPPTDPVATVYSDRTGVSFTLSESEEVTGYQLLKDEFNPVVDTANVTGMSGSASSSGGSYVAPSYALDGNSSTYWMSSWGDSSWWYQINIPRPMRIYGMTISWYAYYGIDYDIQSWTGTQWILEESVRGESYTTRGFAFPQCATTSKLRIRIYKSSNSSYVTIAEIKVTEAIPYEDSPITHNSRTTVPSSYRLAGLSTDYSAYAVDDVPVPASGQEPPAAPSGLTVSDYTATDITLSWNADSGSVAGYNVYNETDDTLLTSSLITTRSYTVSKTIDRDVTSYSYGVSAVNSLGDESERGHLKHPGEQRGT